MPGLRNPLVRHLNNDFRFTCNVLKWFPWGDRARWCQKGRSSKFSGASCCGFPIILHGGISRTGFPLLSLEASQRGQLFYTLEFVKMILAN